MTKKAELKDKDAAESKNESNATGNSFEWKSTEAHEQVATTLQNLGVLISNTNQLLEQINLYGRFHVDIEGQCHQVGVQGNDKFRTMQDMKEEIKFVSMDLEKMSSLEDRLSIGKKINALLEQLGRVEMCAVDESNVRGRSSKNVKEAKDETIVNPVMDDKCFEHKSTKTHQHVVTQLHKLGLGVSTQRQKDIYLSLLDQINRWCRAKSENDWHSLRDVQNNHKKTPSTNLENDVTDSEISEENRVSVVQAHEEKRPSIPMRVQRLERIVGRSFIQRLDLLEECCGIVNDATAGMKIEHRIAQLEQLLE